MDPKSLDPKLQEAYKRVMNTPTKEGGQPAEETQSPDSSPVEQSQPSSEEALPQDIASTEIPVEQAEKIASQPEQSGDSTSPWQASGIPSAQNQSANPTYQPAVAPQNSSSQFKILYIAGAAIFIVLYAVFWLKILGFF